MIIPFSATEFSDIKQSINEYLLQNKDRYKIIDNYEGSIRTMLIDLLAGFATYLNYKSMMYFNESFIKTAVSDYSVMKLATDRYGYNFNRAVSPKIKIKYNELNLDNRVVRTGEVLGTIKLENEEFDIVYFDDTKELEPGEEIIVSIGRANSIKGNFLNFDFKNEIKIDLFSNSMNIDNSDIALFINNNRVPVSRVPENYVVENEALAMSIFYNLARLYIYEDNTKFGYEVNPTDEYEIYYLETYGKVVNLSDYIKNIQFFDNFYFVEIVSYGENADSIEKIRTLAPLYYTTFRVMSNLLSHKIIATAYPGVLDVHVEKKKHACCELEWYILLDGSNETPRYFTDYEKEKYIEYLDYYKFVGMKLTKEDIKIPYVKKKEWTVVVKYDCDTVRDLRINEIISEYVREIINRVTLKLGIHFTVGEILSEISKFTYGGKNIIEEVQIFEDFDDYHSIIPAQEYFTEPNEYFWIDLRVEVGCK